MATEYEYVAAAKKRPKDRTPTERALVDKGKNMQSVRNADFHANEAQRRGY